MPALINAGCGGERPGAPWVNIDIRGESCGDNFVCCDLQQRWPFDDESIDGVLISHFLEHFDCAEGVAMLREAHRVLKKNGCVRILVPSASYHRKVYGEDVADPHNNAVRLFGEQIFGPYKSFMDYALFWPEHKMCFTEDSLWCMLVQAGFQRDTIMLPEHKQTRLSEHPHADILASLDNRILFSLRMEAAK